MENSEIILEKLTDIYKMTEGIMVCFGLLFLIILLCCVGYAFYTQGKLDGKKKIKSKDKEESKDDNVNEQTNKA